MVIEKVETGLPEKVWTIGHSTRGIEEFISLLKSFDIEVLADVRSIPGSSRFPQFNRETLAKSLDENSIKYVHIAELGGRRKGKKDSHNTAWKNASFRAYADYMETEGFRKGIDILLEESKINRTAIMCAEALWWKCHRSMISDYLKSIGIEVIHITGISKSEEHPYTKAAKIIDSKLTYSC
jgi:uncharacterized protein (DUF488 family)